MTEVLIAVFSLLLTVIGWFLGNIYSQQKKTNEKVDGLCTSVEVIKKEISTSRDVCNKTHEMVDFRLGKIEENG
jgi:hypothetical protein